LAATSGGGAEGRDQGGGAARSVDGELQALQKRRGGGLGSEHNGSTGESRWKRGLCSGADVERAAGASGSEDAPESNERGPVAREGVSE
jgi:hypothetical protein